MRPPYQNLIYISNISDYGYKENLYNKSFIYTYIDKTPDGTFLVPNLFQRLRIHGVTHTHPRSSPPSNADLTMVHLFEIFGTVLGWDGSIFNY